MDNMKQCEKLYFENYKINEEIKENLKGEMYHNHGLENSILLRCQLSLNVCRNLLPIKIQRVIFGRN